MNDTNLYQKKRREHYKEQLYKLEKQGGSEQDILLDKTHFRVLLSIVYNEAKKESYPLKISKDMFKFPEKTDITKTSEYNKILRYVKRWENLEIIKKSSEKLKHNLSYYIVDYDKLIECFLETIDKYTGGWISIWYLKKNKNSNIYPFVLDYKGNEYIISIFKLYFYFLSLEHYKMREYNLERAFTNFVRFLFEEIDKQYRDFSNFKLEETDLINYLSKEELKKCNIVVDDEGVIYNSKHTKMVDKGDIVVEEFDIDKIPKEIIEKVRRKKIDAFVNTKNYDIIFNLYPEISESGLGSEYEFNMGMKKYHNKDKKMFNFFFFLRILGRFYNELEIAKQSCKLVIPEILEFVRIKYDSKYYEELDEVQKSWRGEVKDLEKKLDKINEYHFPY